MNPCVFERIGERLVCIKCKRGIKTDRKSVRRICQIQTPLFPCVITTANQIYPVWTVVWLDKTLMDQYNAIRLDGDASTVGSRFASVAHVFAKGSCNCERLRVLLDTASVVFITEHFGTLVDLIYESANKTRTIEINRGFIAAALTLCLKLERIIHGL